MRQAVILDVRIQTYLFFLAAIEAVRFKLTMEIEEEKLRELLTEAFRIGKKTYKADNHSIKLWVESEIQELK